MKKLNKKRIRIVSLNLLVIIGLALAIFLSFLVKKFIMESKFFALKKIVTNLDQIPDYRQEVRIPKELISKQNIFSLDINNLASGLRSSCPKYKDVVIYRQFPNAIYIKFIRRLGLFQIKIADEFWILDDESIVMSSSSNEPYSGKLIVYTALPKGLIVSPGRKIPLSYSENIVLLINELTTQGFFDDFSIPGLYAYNLNDIWFDLDGIEIRVGDGGYAKKLSLLKKIILPRFKADYDKIDYIDLRFKDYVVGYKR